MMAYVLLNEDVNATQWLGIVLIILLIVLMNINWNKVSNAILALFYGRGENLILAITGNENKNLEEMHMASRQFFMCW
jgi:hypothetical protein